MPVIISFEYSEVLKVTEESEWLVTVLAKSLGIGASGAMLLVAVVVVIVRWRAARDAD